MLTKLKLRNYKCFEEEEIPLNCLTLLAGLNGMGKSTVLQSLLLLRQNHENRFLQNKGPLDLNGKYVKLGTFRDLLFQFYRKDSIGIRLESDAKGAGDWRWSSEDKTADHAVLDSEEDRGADFFDLALFGDHFHYISADRLGPRSYYETSSYEVKTRKQIGVLGEYCAQYLAEYGNNPIADLKLKYPGSEDLGYGNTLNEQVNAWLNVIRPGTEVFATRSTDLGLVRLYFQFVGGRERSNEFRPTNVGFGLSYLLPLFISVLHSPPGTLILLENPEAHIHPKGQAEIGRFIALAASRGIQVILETHSDHILNGIRVAVKQGVLDHSKVGIHFFTGLVSEGKFVHYVENITVNANGRLSPWPEDFFDTWDKELTNLL